MAVMPFIASESLSMSFQGAANGFLLVGEQLTISDNELLQLGEE